MDVKLSLCCAAPAGRGSSGKACRGFTSMGEKQEKRGGSSATLQLLQEDTWAMKQVLTFTPWSKT